MEILLRKIVVDEQGQTQLTDYELQADTIHIGSAPDSELQLLGPRIKALHAQLRMQEEGLRLTAEKGQHFLLNGERHTQAELQVNDEIEIDQHRLVVIEPTPGFDLTLAWHPADVDGGLLANAYQTTLAQTDLKTRSFAWIALTIIVILAGLLPAADYLLRTFNNNTVTSQSDQKENITHRFTADSFWNTGPLHSAHKVAIGDQCEACHEKAFVKVQDQACTQCHGTTQEHIPLHSEINAQHAALFAGQQCQNCHKEHNEPEQLTNRQDALCQSCHKNLEPRVKGFDQKSHPAFRLSLLTPDVKKQLASLTTEWQIKKAPLVTRPDTTVSALQENSHLKFSHQVHLDMDKVRHANTDEQLVCSNCHALSADREHFQPITMEQNCIGCHELSFDPNQPTKQLPHGDIAKVYPTLEAHFVSLAFNEQLKPQIERRRLPAKTNTDKNCKADFECAKALAIKENDRQFSQSGCVTCHQIVDIDGVEASSRWQLLPVRLTSDWYPDAQFDHRSHLTQSGDSENQRCSSCHNAFDSDSSYDILIPAMDNCTQCHGDQSHSNKVVLECVSCHRYHPFSSSNSASLGNSNALTKSLRAIAASDSPAAPSQTPTTEPSTHE